MSHKVAGEIAKLKKQIEYLQDNNTQLQGDMGFLKDIVHKALMTSNPDYKRSKVLREMEDFLK